METTKQPIGFALRKIVTDQFAIIEDSYFESSKVGMNTSVSFQSTPQDNVIIVFAKFKFESDNKVFLLIEVGCYFKIKEESWSSLVDDGSIKLIKSFAIHLSMITIGTARGVLHAKTENTPFNKFVIPTVNVNELIKEDIIIKMDSVQ